MQRQCRCCGEIKSLYEDFYKARKDKDGPSAWAYECKECTRARVAEEYKKDPLPTRNRHLKRKYGITLDDYNVMLEKQNHCCALCETSEPGGRWNMFAVDHCHETGNIRGLLCKRCNIALGELKDDVTILESAIKYINESRQS